MFQSVLFTWNGVGIDFGQVVAWKREFHFRQWHATLVYVSLRCWHSWPL